MKGFILIAVITIADEMFNIYQNSKPPVMLI